MLIILIKYSAIIICSLYTYIKILNIKGDIKLFLQFTIYLLVILPVIYILRITLPEFSLFFMVISFSLFLQRVTNNPPNLSLTITIISFCFVYFTFIISSLLIVTIGFLISHFTNEIPSKIFLFPLIILLQVILVATPFHFRRFKNGMPFLIKHGSSNIGVYISILLLITASFFGIDKEAKLIYVIPFLFCIICGSLLLLWWRNSITQNYIDKLRAREQKELQLKIQQKNDEIEYLKHHNDELSKIIHKDNKLIPAMEFTIKEYLLTAKHEESRNILINKAEALLVQLESISKERSGILNNYETENKRLPQTNIISIDGLLSFYLQKANENKIIFDLSISGNLENCIKNTVNELDLRTLLADIIENALYATIRSTKKNILVNMGVYEPFFSLEIFDSGEVFTFETLLNIGLKRVTTHLNDGGSGIGLMTIFEIIRKYRASFILEEFMDTKLFTKKISVQFDNLCQFQIKTYRINELKSLFTRSDIDLVSNDL